MPVHGGWIGATLEGPILGTGETFLIALNVVFYADEPQAA
jgi:hypothetical protein